MSRGLRAALVLLVAFVVAGCGGLSREGPVQPGREGLAIFSDGFETVP